MKKIFKLSLILSNLMVMINADSYSDATSIFKNFKSSVSVTSQNGVAYTNGGFFDSLSNKTIQPLPYITNRVITTKLSGYEIGDKSQFFNLITVSLKKIGNKYKLDSKPIGMWYYLYDKDTSTKIPNTYRWFPPGNQIKIEQYFIPNSYRNVKVVYELCSKLKIGESKDDSTSLIPAENANKYNLYNYAECISFNHKNYCSKPNETGKCIRKFESTDNFAIRARYFQITMDNEAYENENIKNVDIKTILYSTPVYSKIDTNYNNNSDNIKIDIDAESGRAFAPIYNFIIENGEAKDKNVKYLKYPNADVIRFVFSEKLNGKEFAAVDEKDFLAGEETEDELLIKGESNKITIKSKDSVRYWPGVGINDGNNEPEKNTNEIGRNKNIDRIYHRMNW